MWRWHARRRCSACLKPGSAWCRHRSRLSSWSGYSEARRLAVTGGKIDALGALRLRLVHGVHEGEDAMNTALESVLTDIRKGAPDAITQTKRLMRRARLHDAGSLIDDAAKVFAAAVRSEEGAEGLSAFIEKRPAKWVQG